VVVVVVLVVLVVVVMVGVVAVVVVVVVVVVVLVVVNKLQRGHPWRSLSNLPYPKAPNSWITILVGLATSTTQHNAACW